MGLLSASLFSPTLETDHPLTIIPNLDAADQNPVKYMPRRGGIENRKQTEAYTIMAEKVFGAVEYRVYGSLSPSRQENLIRAGLTTPEYVFHPQWITDIAVYYFWMTSVDADGVETYYTDDPATLAGTAEKLAFTPNPLTADACFMPEGSADLLNTEIGKVFTTIRKSNRLELELNGEPALIYLRRHAEDKPWGVPCTCTFDNVLDEDGEEEGDSDYQGLGNCKLCFGTGIFGGYYPAIPIAIRYMDAPDKVYKPTKRGFELNHAFNTYMLQTPIVRTGDIVVRSLSGERYWVEKVRQSSVRGINLSQAFDMNQIPRDDIRGGITNAAIAKALEKVQFPDYFKEGYRTFG